MFRIIIMILCLAIPKLAFSQTEDQVCQLNVKKSQIVGDNGFPIQLRGMSSHGLQWFGHVVNRESLKDLVDRWGITVFRAAMYTAQGGYINDRRIKDKVIGIVDTAIELGIWVVIDWHILYDNNPQMHQSEAMEFFADMSKRYAGIPNVIYEICNEPNGNVSWRGNIKPYAEAVIKEIRKNDPKNLIIVGSGSWSQDIHDPANDPIKADNIAYAVHFYAGSHGKWLRDRIDFAMGKGIAVVATEWGTTGSSGNGSVYINESREWLDFLDSRKISWINWSYSNAGESSAALLKDGRLSQSGQWVKSRMLKF